MGLLMVQGRQRIEGSTRGPLNATPNPNILLFITDRGGIRQGGRHIGHDH